MMKVRAMRNRHPYLIILLLLALCGAESRAQPRYQAPLPDSGRSGFYFIPLPPAIIGHSQYQLEDLRIFDRDDREVPYAAWDDPGVFTGSRFLPFTILSYKKDTDRQSHLILANKAIVSLSDIVLKLRNTEAARQISVSGSSDLKDWYAIRDAFPLTPSGGDHNGIMQASVHLPHSFYRYYDITILGEDALPPDILSAGIYQEFQTNSPPSALPLPRISRQDSVRGTTYIGLGFDAHYKIDELRFYISGPALYHRKVRISQAGTHSDAAVETFLTSTTKPAIVQLDLQGTDVDILIENGNSPPLRIDSIVAYQHNRFLLAYLEAGNHYRLVCGDSTLRAPIYDLAYFKDSARASAVPVIPGALGAYVEQNPRRDVRATGNPVEAPRSYKWLLWLTLLVVSALVVALVLKMMRDVKARS